MDSEALPPRSLDELSQLLTTRGEALPARLRQCAKHVLNYPDQIALSTAAEIAEAAGVQRSTLVRFAQTLGFQGFSELQRLYRDHLRSRRADYSARILHLRENREISHGSLLHSFAENAKTSLDNLLRDTDPKALSAAVRCLSRARTIYLVGLRRAFPVVSYLDYVLAKLQVPARMLDGVSGMISERGYMVDQDDAVLVVTFAPYSPEVVDFASLAYGRGTPVVAMTDHALSPVARVATALLEVREAELSGFRSSAATMCLAVSLAIAIGDARRSSEGQAA